jgi:hypothetical protein
MAVVLSIISPDRPMYEAVTALLDLDADPPHGLIVHTASEVDGQVHVTDVWESQDDIDSFFQQRLGKAFAEAGLQPVGEPVMRETFNTFRP